MLCLKGKRNNKRWICLTANLCAFFYASLKLTEDMLEICSLVPVFWLWVVVVWILWILVRGVCRSMHIFKRWQKWPQFCARTVTCFWADALLPCSDLEHRQNKLRSESGVRCQQKRQFPALPLCQQKRFVVNWLWEVIQAAINPLGEKL